MIQRPPRHPALAPWIESLWASAPGLAGQTVAPPYSERVLPTGHMHIAFRLNGFALEVRANGQAQRLSSCALVGGVRLAGYERTVSRPSASVGAVLFPGAAQQLLGTPADELAGTHNGLELLPLAIPANTVLAQLHDASTAKARLNLLEAWLLACWRDQDARLRARSMKDRSAAWCWRPGRWRTNRTSPRRPLCAD